MRVSTNEEEVFVIASYCSTANYVTNLNPILEELNLQLQKCPSDNVVLMGDFIAVFPLGATMDRLQMQSRGCLSPDADLEVINNPESAPTFIDWKGMSWIYNPSYRQCSRRIADWEISRASI